MKLTRVLHPEVVLGLRGNPSNVKFYRNHLASTEKCNQFLAHKYEQGADNGRAWLQHMDACLKFIKERPQTYLISRNFQEALLKIKGKIPLDLVPSQWFAYVALSEPVPFDGGKIDGAYIRIQEKTQEGTAILQKKMTITYTFENQDYGVGNLGFIMEEKSAEQLLTHINEEVFKGSLTHQLHKAALIFINAVMYITGCSDADIKHSAKAGHLSKTRRKEIEKRVGAVNLCMLDVKLVSWNYHHPSERNYTAGEVWVDTYQRWQRFGEGFKQVKLIWVKPHVRVYGSEEQVEE